MDEFRLVIEIISLSLLAGSVFYAARQIKSSHDWNRRKAAQDIAIKYAELNPNKVVINEFLERIGHKEALKLEELKDEFKRASDLRDAIDTLLNFYEFLAMGVAQKVYDEKLIRIFWGEAMSTNRIRYKSYIDNSIKEEYPDLWRYFISYTAKWDSQKNQIQERGSTG
ncbi:MAG: DUF4760 domain-containing protein [Pseudomonadota bacterium]|nr:DUF4760 domain-containing protein [Pseudomonadota bacterium]